MATLGASAGPDELPIVVVADDYVLVERELVSNTRPLTDMGRVQKVDELWEALKRRREHWLKDHAGQHFPGVCGLRLAPATPLLVAKSGRGAPARRGEHEQAPGPARDARPDDEPRGREGLGDRPGRPRRGSPRRRARLAAGPCRGMGARLLCYFSSQYEEWRDDAADFGALGDPLDGWPGDRWVDPADPANLAVMVARLDVAAQKGCDGVDIDNVDHAGHEDYVAAIYGEARARALLVSQKNAVEKIALFFDLVDLYQNEQCQEYAECAAYENVGRPVHNIEYTPCHTLPYLYSQRKDPLAMDAWEELCPP